MSWLRQAWASHRWLTLGFSLAVLLTLLLAARFTISVVYWSAHHDVEISPWMTVGYVARSHRVPPFALFEAVAPSLGLARGRRESIRDIAERLGRPEEEIAAEILAAIEALTAEPAQ